MASTRFCARCAGKTELRLKGKGYVTIHLSSGKPFCPVKKSGSPVKRSKRPRGSEVGKSAKDLMDFDSKDPHQSTLAGRRQAVLDLLKGRTT